ncbi:hypothetical protein [Prevotella denticola]|nr:hypothetical protein [Prevotella denticola]
MQQADDVVQRYGSMVWIRHGLPFCKDTLHRHDSFDCISVRRFLNMGIVF